MPRAKYSLGTIAVELAAVTYTRSNCVEQRQFFCMAFYESWLWTAQPCVIFTGFHMILLAVWWCPVIILLLGSKKAEFTYYRVTQGVAVHLKIHFF